MAEYNKSRFYWIKLTDRFMTSDTVDFLMEQKGGANYVVLYQMLCLKTVNQNGELARTLGEIIVPYDAEKIQRDMKWFSIDTVRVALELYKKLGLIYEQENGTLKITDFDKMIGSQTISAYKKQIQLENKGGIKVEKIPPYIDIDKDIDIDKEEIKEKVKKEKFIPPSFEDVKEYAISRDREDLAQRFYDYFTEGNWTDSKGQKVKNWKQKFITWETHNSNNKENLNTIETDSEYLLRKDYSEEYVNSLSPEELKEKVKKLKEMWGD